MNFPDHAIYAAFNGRVFALDRRDGSILWRWTTPKGGNFVTLLPDGDQLLVCSNGYLWALRAEDGDMPMEPTVQGRRHGNPLLGQPQIRLRNPDSKSHGSPRRRGTTSASIDDSFQHSQHVVILTVAKNDSPTRAGPFRMKRSAPNRRPKATGAHHRILSGKNSRMRSS